MTSNMTLAQTWGTRFAPFATPSGEGDASDEITDDALRCFFVSSNCSGKRRPNNDNWHFFFNVNKDFVSSVMELNE